MKTMTIFRAPSHKKAFTLIEVILVLTLLALLAALATSTHRNSARKAKETVLRNNLTQLRTTLDQYNVDKGYYPESLEILVEEGYLRELPLDPITSSRDTWQVIYLENYDDEDSNYEPGVYDIRSGSQESAIDGTFYYEW